MRACRYARPLSLARVRVCTVKARRIRALRFLVRRCSCLKQGLAAMPPAAVMTTYSFPNRSTMRRPLLPQHRWLWTFIARPGHLRPGSTCLSAAHRARAPRMMHRRAFDRIKLAARILSCLHRGNANFVQRPCPFCFLAYADVCSPPSQKTPYSPWVSAVGPLASRQKSRQLVVRGTSRGGIASLRGTTGRGRRTEVRRTTRALRHQRAPRLERAP